MQCVDSIFGICLVRASGTTSVFGFSDFVAALALLLIIYTISDVRYRFRISVAPAPLFGISFVLICVIGVGTLVTDIWLSEHWLVPNTLITAAIWQGALAALLLGMVITWLYYAYIKPPVFGQNNYKKYAQELYRLVLKGSELELPVIAHELAASAKALVSFAENARKSKTSDKGKRKPLVQRYASDILLLIANPKFCRHLVASSPITAIRFLNAVADSKAYQVPIGQFVQNVSIEAIRNKDSGLYHEDDGYRSGLLGYVKPLSQSLYGNYELVEGLDHHSSLDIHYKSVWSWDADQFETYCRAVHMTFKSYMDGGHWGEHSYALTRAISEIEGKTTRTILDIKKDEGEYISDAWSQLRAGVGFIKDCIETLGAMNPVPEPHALRFRKEQNNHVKDIYDRLAEAMFEIIHFAAYIDSPPERAWSLQYNSVWSVFFGFLDNRAWKVVRFKLRRLLYNEIREFDTLPQYKAARVLGICLNVMGFSAKRSGHGREYAALRVAVLAWTQDNYLRLREVNADIADACLIGSVTFDGEHSRLVKTYTKGLRQEAPLEYLPLRASAPAA